MPFNAYKHIDLGKHDKTQKRIVSVLYDHLINELAKVDSGTAGGETSLPKNAKIEVNEAVLEMAKAQANQISLNELRLIFSKRIDTLLKSV